jgi:DHA1 family bicyclomycin/chloramphenicol resistance-like MFS transporter
VALSPALFILPAGTARRRIAARCSIQFALSCLPESRRFNKLTPAGINQQFGTLRDIKPIATTKTTLALLVALSGIGHLAFNIYLPSVPNIAAALGVTGGQVQYTISVYLISFACGQLFIGALSDRFGRKPVLLAGLGLYVVSAFVCAFAGALWVMIAGRIVQALGGCAGFVIGRAVIRDMNERNAAASMLGYVTMAMMLVPAAAPGIGGLIDHWFGWRASFVVLIVAGVAVMTATVFKLPETNPGRSSRFALKPFLAGYTALLGSPPFLGYALCSAFSTTMFFTFAAGTPHILMTLMGLTPAEYGAYFALSPLGYIIGNFLSGRLSRTYGTEIMIVTGNLIALSGITIMASLAVMGFFSPIAVCAPYFVVALSNGLTVTNTVAGAVSVNPRLAGTAAGLIGFMQMGFAGCAVWLVGTLHASNALPMISIILICGLAAFTSAFTTRHIRARALEIHAEKPQGS